MLSSLFDKSIGKIKRFTYYLLGARSVFSLFMKYQRIYWQYNQELQYQSELSQNAIALSLAPAFEFLSNVIAYASIAFARFIELLTGVNVLSKVSTKGIRDYNKALKESQSLLSGIDEITNLTLPSSTGLADQYKALKNFQDMTKEFDEWANRFLTETLPAIGEGIKNWFIGTPELREKIRREGLIGYTFGEIKNMLANMYENVFKPHVDLLLERLKEDLAPIWEPIKTAWDNLWTELTPLWEKIFTPIENAYTQFKQNILRQLTPFINTLISIWNNTFGYLFGKIDYLETDTQSFLHNLTKEQKEALKQMGIDVDAYADNSETNMDEIKEKFTNLTDEQKKQLKELGLNIEDVSTTGNKNVDKLQQNIEDINNTKTTFSISATVSNAESTLKSFFKKLGINFGSGKLSTTIGIAIKSVGETLSTAWANVKKAFGFAKGLDYVPYDEFPALLHKGEAVVPAKYNPTIHSQGNEYTNSLLELMVEKIDDLSRRPNVFEIDGQQFANATYSLYDDARKNQNYVEGVVR